MNGHKVWQDADRRAVVEFLEDMEAVIDNSILVADKALEIDNSTHWKTYRTYYHNARSFIAFAKAQALSRKVEQ